MFNKNFSTKGKDKKGIAFDILYFENNGIMGILLNTMKTIAMIIYQEL